MVNIRLLYWWDTLRNKLWFIPSLFCFGALLFAVLTLNIDHTFEVGSKSLFPMLETTGTSGRIVLGALIGALVTVVGLAYSLTMLSVSQTSSQYGPRLIRSLFDSNVTQYTLGLFLGTIVYCMVILRSIRDLDSSGSLFTPHLSILIAELGGASSLFGLLNFTNHMTRCMRAETLVKDIYRDLITTTNHLFPEVSQRNQPFELTDRAEWVAIEGGDVLHSRTSGYLQAIDLPSLLQTAVKNGQRVQVEQRPGSFIYEGSRLATIETSAEMPEEELDKILTTYRDYFLTGSVRTPRQDIEAAVMELVEAGVRALSPGVNDPMTAINVVDYLASFFRQLANRPWPQSVILDDRSEPRVCVKLVSFASVLNTGFDQLRQNADSSVAVHCRLLEALTAIREATGRGDDSQAVERQAEMVLEQARRNIVEERDLHDIERRAKRILAGALPGQASG